MSELCEYQLVSYKSEFALVVCQRFLDSVRREYETEACEFSQLRWAPARNPLRGFEQDAYVLERPKVLGECFLFVVYGVSHQGKEMARTRRVIMKLEKSQ